MSRDLQMVLSYVIEVNGRIDQLSLLQQALQCSASTSISPGSQNSDSTLACAAAVKSISISIETDSAPHEATHTFQSALQDISGGSSVDLDMKSVDLKDFMQVKGNSDMGIATYKNDTVIVEYKTLPTQSRSKIIARAQDLARLLSTAKHPDFRSLRCRGVFHDSDRAKIGFVYELPSNGTLSSPQSYKMPSSDTVQPPLSLRSVFAAVNPSVTDRVNLALKITQSVKYFHTAGWLHKDIRSENVIFLFSGDTGPTSPALLSMPLLAGFSFSRLDSPTQISEQPSSDPQRDIYRHPEAMGEPSSSFSAAKGIYSLGTVLLEIGEWRSLRNLVNKVVDVSKPNVPTIELAKVRPFLLDEGPQGGLGALKFRMGDVYAGITKMMLRGEVQEPSLSEKDEHLMFRPDPLDLAIRELRRCVI